MRISHIDSSLVDSNICSGFPSFLAVVRQKASDTCALMHSTGDGPLGLLCGPW